MAKAKSLETQRAAALALYNVSCASANHVPMIQNDCVSAIALLGKVADLYPERTYDKWTEIDPRVAWIADWLKSNKKTKVVCICGTADIAISLEK